MEIYDKRGVRLYTIAEVAEAYGITRRSVSTYLLKDKFPQPTGRVGREPLWAEDQLEWE